MPIAKKAGVVGLMILAFFVYFSTESLLRQAAISNINPQSVNVDALLSKLPQSIRESASQKIELTRLKNAVSEAKDDAGKAVAISNLADYTKEREEKERLYAEILREYPSQSESYRAYAFFLMNPESAVQISIQDFHKFLEMQDAMSRLNPWVSGFNKLNQLRASPNELLLYLSPLLNEAPQYKDYANLFRELSKVGAKLKRADVSEKADAMAEACKKLPSVDDVLRKKADAEKAKQKK